MSTTCSIGLSDPISARADGDGDICGTDAEGETLLGTAVAVTVVDERPVESGLEADWHEAAISRTSGSHALVDWPWGLPPARPRARLTDVPATSRR